MEQSKIIDTLETYQGVKACIDLTLYAELFITSIIEKHILIYSKDNF